MEADEVVAMVAYVNFAKFQELCFYFLDFKRSIPNEKI
jgi:hypothetical protein